MKVPRYFPFLLILSATAAAMEVDLSLPSFPDIARAFGVSEEMVERTISLNFIGFCLSGLCYGPLADRFGRRPVMLLGATLFLIGSLGCAMATSMGAILSSRFIQGMGASASCIIVFTMIADVYEGNEATAWIGRLNAILTAAMAAAPILGGILNAAYGWRGCYTAMAVGTVVVFLAQLFLLPETREGRPVKLAAVVSDYRSFLASPRFVEAMWVPVLLAGGYMSFVSVIPFIYRDEIGVSLTAFSFHQAGIIASFSVVSYYASRVSAAFGERRAAIGGLTVSAVSTSLVVVISLFTPLPSPWIITGLMMCFGASCAIAFAVLFSSALGLFPNKGGAASSILMSIRTLVCAGTIQLAGSLYHGRVLEPSAIVAACCIASLYFAVRFYGSIEAAEAVASQV